MKSGIYLLRNVVNGKFYIGSAMNTTKRKSEHFGFLSRGCHPNVHLQAAWNNYGRDSLEFDVIIICEVEHLLKIEQGFLDMYWGTEQCYNMARSAKSPSLGRTLPVWSETRREKIRKFNESYVPTDATREKMRIARAEQPIRSGFSLTEEHKAKLRKSHGKCPKISIAMKGNTNGRVLDEAMVKNIRTESISRKELAKKYGVTTHTVGDIITRKTWRNI